MKFYLLIVFLLIGSSTGAQNKQIQTEKILVYEPGDLKNRVFKPGLPFNLHNTKSNLYKPINIGTRRELFVDRYLIDTLKGADLKLNIHSIDQYSKDQQVFFSGFPAPDEKSYIYSTILKEDSIFRLYYRGYAEGVSGRPCETFCYATSTDGISFYKPDIGLFEVNGSTHNNVLLTNVDYFAHNFCPMIDTRPGVPLNQKYKALAGHRRGGGLKAFTSADGIHWGLLTEDFVLKVPDYSAHGFDSQNVSFWSEEEQCYVAYFRTWKMGVTAVIMDIPQYGVRWISRSTSKDYIHWSDPVEMKPDNLCYEHIYASQTSPYYRAPHIYIAPATRFVAVGLDTEINTTDITLMTTRSASHVFNRTFMESFIRPGLDQIRWTNRSNYTTLNIVPVNDRQMAIYICGSAHELKRILLRIDGIASLHAGYEGGEMITKPFIFEGNSLDVNYMTSSVGSINIEVLRVNGEPVNGFTLAEFNTLNGDKISQDVQWQSVDDGKIVRSDLGKLAGKEIRLKFVLKDADVCSFKFH